MKKKYRTGTGRRLLFDGGGGGSASLAPVATESRAVLNEGIASPGGAQ